MYLNTNSDSKPVLGRGTFLESNGSVINAGERATPVAYDWNNDGRKDILIGNMEGNIIVYFNEGTDAMPVFGVPHFLLLNGNPLDLGTRTAPRVFDWNNDGLKDLLIGEAQGYVYYLKNSGTDASPVFRRAEKLLLVNGDYLQYPDPEGFARSRLFVSDWNNDGRSDIVLGGRDGRILLFLSATSPLLSPRYVLNRTYTHIKETVLKAKTFIRSALTKKDRT